jgi:hypothetical protein
MFFELFWHAGHAFDFILEQPFAPSSKSASPYLSFRLSFHDNRWIKDYLPSEPSHCFKRNMHSILLNEPKALAFLTGRFLSGEFTEECGLNGC